MKTKPKQVKFTTSTSVIRNINTKIMQKGINGNEPKKKEIRTELQKLEIVWEHSNQ